MGQNSTGDSPDKRGLYKYSQEEIDSFLNSIGYPKHYSRYIRRNSDGSSLIFFSNKAKEAIAISCNGTVRRIELPGAIAWLNDKLEIIAWSDEENTFFANGVRRNGIISPYGADPSGNYFLRRPNWVRGKTTSEITEIFSIDRPDFPLAKIQMRDPNSRLFMKNDTLLLIGKPADNTNILTIHRFKITSNTLVLLDEKKIIRPQPLASPFNVIDLSPWSDDVLVVDGRDFPAKSKWYVYHMPNKQLEYFGSASTYGFYLQCDPLRNIQKQKGPSR